MTSTGDLHWWPLLVTSTGDLYSWPLLVTSTGYLYWLPLLVTSTGDRYRWLLLVTSTGDLYWWPLLVTSVFLLYLNTVACVLLTCDHLSALLTRPILLQPGGWYNRWHTGTRADRGRGQPSLCSRLFSWRLPWRVPWLYDGALLPYVSHTESRGCTANKGGQGITHNVRYWWWS